VELESVYGLLHREVPSGIVAIVHRVNGFAGSGQGHLISGEDEFSQRWVLTGREGRGGKERAGKSIKGREKSGEKSD
jgi:hypothetical protein